MDELFVKASTIGSAPKASISDGRDKLFVGVALALALFFVYTIASEGLGLSVSIFVLLFYGAAFAYLGARPGGLQRSGWQLLIPIGTIVLCYGLYDNLLLQLLNVPLLCLLTALQLSAMTGNRLYKPASVGTVIDALNTMVVLPIVNVPASFAVLAHSKTGKRAKGASPVLIGLLISLPILLVVGTLLVSADFLLEELLRGFLRNLRFNIGDHVSRVIAAGMLAIPLYGLFFALRHSKAEQKTADISRAQRTDPRTFATIIGMLNGAYLLFIGIQFGYLFNAFLQLLPQGFTYADYARRGFGELVAVIVINIIILTLSLLLSQRNVAGSRLLKATETLLVALTLLLCVSEMTKMVLYMDVYGLTQLRVYVTWFIVLCAAFFVAVCVKLYCPRFRLIRFCASAFLVWFMALNLVDVDARIAQYNIHAYKFGWVNTLDIDTLDGLSSSSVPYLAQLTQHEDPAIAKEAKEALASRSDLLYGDSWQTATLSRWRAQNILSQMK